MVDEDLDINKRKFKSKYNKSLEELGYTLFGEDGYMYDFEIVYNYTGDDIRLKWTNIKVRYYELLDKKYLKITFSIPSPSQEFEFENMNEFIKFLKYVYAHPKDDLSSCFENYRE